MEITPHKKKGVIILSSLLIGFLAGGAISGNTAASTFNISEAGVELGNISLIVSCETLDNPQNPDAGYKIAVVGENLQCDVANRMTIPPNTELNISLLGPTGEVKKSKNLDIVKEDVSQVSFSLKESGRHWFEITSISEFSNIDNRNKSLDKKNSGCSVEAEQTNNTTQYSVSCSESLSVDEEVSGRKKSSQVTKTQRVGDFMVYQNSNEYSSRQRSTTINHISIALAIAGISMAVGFELF